MQFYVISNSKQEAQLNNLEKLHEATWEHSDNFNDLLKTFVKKYRNDKERPYYFDKIADIVRHIIYNFEKYQEEPDNKESQETVLEKDYTMMLSFFFNANAFINLIKDSKIKNKVKSDNDLSKSIKFFRDCFAHQYEKELIRGGDKYYIPHIMQRGMVMLDMLEMRDLDSGAIIYEASFSLRHFYFSLKEIFETFLKLYENKTTV